MYTPEQLEAMKKQWDAAGLDGEALLKQVTSAMDMQQNMMSQMGNMMQGMMGNLQGDALNIFDDSPEVKEDCELSAEEQKAILCGANLSYYNSQYINTLETYMPADDIKQGLGGSWGINSKEELSDTLDWLENTGHKASYDLIWDKLRTLPKPEWKLGISNLEELAAKNEEIDESRIHEFAVGLLDTYPNLLAAGAYEGKDHPNVIAWDLARAINLARYGYDAKWYTKAEAMDRIMRYAKKMYAAYDSWKDLANGYLIGFGMWSGNEMLLSERMEQAEVLLTHEKSLWKTVSF